jgi:hypothetical protein
LPPIPVGHEHIPPLQVPPLMQVTPLQAVFEQEVYNTAPNTLSVNIVLSAMCLIDLITNFLVNDKIFVKDKF